MFALAQIGNGTQSFRLSSKKQFAFSNPFLTKPLNRPPKIGKTVQLDKIEVAMFSKLQRAANHHQSATSPEATRKSLFYKNLRVTPCGSRICRQTSRSNPHKSFAIKNLTKNCFSFSGQPIFRHTFALRRASGALFLAVREKWGLSQTPLPQFAPCI
jgi:hypothetical protein